MAFNDSDFIPEQQNFNDSDFIPEIHNESVPGSLSSSLQGLIAGPAAALKGFGQIGYNINQLGTSAANAILPKNRQLAQPQSPFNYQTSGDPVSSYLYNTEQNYPITTAIGNTIGRIAATLPLTAVAPEGGAINSIVDNTASGALGGALDDPNNLGQSTAWGALTGGILGVAGQGVNYLRQNITNALNNPVNQAFDRLGIQNAPLGERLQNPALIHASQSGLTRIPFSGAAQNYVDVGAQIENKVSDAVNSFRPDMAQSEIPAVIQKALQSSAKYESNVKNVMYQNHADYMNSIGATADTSSALSAAEDLKNSNPEVYNKIEPIISTIKGNVDPSTGFRTGADFGDTSLAAGQLNNLGQKYLKSPDPFVRSNAADVFNIRKQLTDGMDVSTQATNDPKAIGLWQAAQDNYSQNYAPFLDPDIARYLSRGSKADNPDLLISSFLKTGPNNQPTLLNKLMSKLPDDQKNAAGYYFLTRSLPKDETGAPIINSNTVTKVNDSLQNYMPAIRDSLIPPDVQQTLNAASIARRSIPNTLFNPPNGMQMADVAALGGMGSTFLTGLLSSHPALMGLPFATMAGGRVMQKAMTSPVFRHYITQQNSSNLSPLLSNIINGIRGSQSQ